METGRDNGLPVSGVVDAAIARDEALEKFQKINWNDYTRSGTFGITADDVSLFRKIESLMSTENVSIVNGFLSSNGENLCHGLTKILCNITEPTVVRYALARIEYLLPDGSELRHRVEYFLNEKKVIDSAPYLRLIRSGQGYVEHAASHILAKMLSVKSNEEGMQALIDWIVQCLSLGTNAVQLNDPVRSSSARAAVGTLMALLRNERARLLFTRANGLKLLANVLNNAAGRAQLIYEIGFDLWTLTFCKEAVEQFGTSGALDALIKQILSAPPREKITRVMLAALRNLIGRNNGTYNETMIESGLTKTLNQMKERKWTDKDIEDDIHSIRDVLIREFKVLTTMERYEKEIRTGQLTWGLLHTDKFWKENYMGFEKRSFELIKLLIELLDSEDNTTVAVALYDLGDFVRFYPNGKLIAKTLGAKKVVMRLLTAHEDPQVKKHALQCMSKMMVNKWEFVK